MSRASPERDLHIDVVKLLMRQCEPGVIWWHSNNNVGRRDGARRGAQLKRLGVRAGVPDFVFLTPSRKMCCFLELKSAKGTLTPTQLDFGMAVKLLGCRYEIARTLDEAADYLRDIGALRQIDIRRRAAA